MKITPLDIQQMGFKIRWKGYDREEVDTFLSTLTEDYEALIKENLYLKEQMAHVEAELTELKKKEVLLSQTLISAQGLVEMQKANTLKESTMMIREAEVQGEQIIKNVKEEAARLRSDLIHLKRQKLLFIEHLRSMVKSFEVSLSVEEQAEKETEKLS
ncbi:MAG: DivIVA domain-containing protein [Nitrospirae bacterium]|nr:DivIVA domain-containing protein [Nitrospirota bacterium]MBI3351236.1 DivIVA domain-containing protein [Nitrospirota bacterium]